MEQDAMWGQEKHYNCIVNTDAAGSSETFAHIGTCTSRHIEGRNLNTLIHVNLKTRNSTAQLRFKNLPPKFGYESPSLDICLYKYTVSCSATY
jgi:hypothetical protein